MVPPVAAFFFESDLDFETGCYVSYVKEKAIKCFESTLGSCFDKLLGQTKEISKAKASTTTLKASCALRFAVGSERAGCAGLQVSKQLARACASTAGCGSATRPTRDALHRIQ